MNVIELKSFGGPEVLELAERPLPVPAPGQVRVLARAIGAGGPDVMIRNGTYKWMPPLPAVPGNELAGVVDAVGDGVTQLRSGDRVFVSARELPYRGGCYAEAVCVPEDVPFRLPDELSFDDAVSLGNFQLALALLASSGEPSVRSILVPGAAGGVATALAQVARDRGVHVIGTASTEAKRAFALENGVHDLVNPDPATLPARVMEVTQGRGVDIAFDHLGGAMFIACLRSLAPSGMAVSYNIVTGPPADDVFAEMRKLLARSLAIRTFSIHAIDSDRTVRRGLVETAMQLMASGRVRAPRAVHFALTDARRAHALLDSGGSFGKVVLHP